MFTLYRWVNIIQHVKISSIFWTLIRFADCKWACHPSVLRDHGPVPKKLYFSCWCRHSICYGCTGPHKNDSLDSNQCMWNVTMLFPFLWACFSPWQQVSASFFLTPAFDIIPVSIMSDCWQRLPNSWYEICPLFWCHFCRHPWSKDEVALMPSCRWSVPCKEGPLKSFHQ